jgi:tetratricopeptide (TPR) repeat protein
VLLATASLAARRDALASCSVLDEVPRPGGRETELLADAADGRLTAFSLPEAALIAEGIRSPARLRLLTAKFDAWEKELRSRAPQALPAHARAAAVFKFMHQRVLTGRYEAGCNELSRTIRYGDFNCVTATIVYLDLTRRCGLSLVGIGVPGHVRARLKGPESLDIETTCPVWFPPSCGARESLCPDSQSPAKAHAPAPGRILSDCALVAKIYYNRGSRLLDEGRFADSIAATRAALTLDVADETARKNLLAAYNNWALSLCEKRNYAEAAALVIFARAEDPEFAPLASNDLHIHQQWVLHLCESGRFAEALSVLENGYRRLPEAELFDEGRDAVRRWWAESVSTVHTSDVEMD